MPLKVPRVGLFCGSLHREKRLDYMIAAADRVRKACRDFHLVVMGDGPCADEISVAARTRPWLHWVGSRKVQRRRLGSN